MQSRSDAGEIWRRFPKFVLGFLVASAVVTLVSKGYDYAAYKKDVVPGLVAPLQALRTWAFTFAFLSIGLTTKFREFVSVGARPFYAFTAEDATLVAQGYAALTALRGPRAEDDEELLGSLDDGLGAALAGFEFSA